MRTSVITVRNSSCGKAMFSQAYVILSTGGGVHPPGRQTPPQADPPRHTPPRQPLQRMVRILLVCLLVTVCNIVAARYCFYTCLSFCPQWVCVSQHALEHPPPPRQTSHPNRRLLQRTVRILLEYILVLFIFLKSLCKVLLKANGYHLNL